MYAVIETGGKQYRVEVGTELQVELLDVEPGKTITLDRVLLVADGETSSIGRPLVAAAAVSAEVVRQIRGEKLISFKYRPKARSRVKKGHRQELTVLRISDITLDGKSAARTAEKAHDDAKTERQRLEEAAVAQAAKDAELASKLAAGADAPVKAPAKGKPAPPKAEAAESTTKSKQASAKASAPAKGNAAPAKGNAAPAKGNAAPAKGKASPAKAAAPKAAAAAPKAAAPKKADTTTKADTTSKPSRAKAASDTPAKADAPKRSRATKKDE
jgi:large subunit ribosomal protein L21